MAKEREQGLKNYSTSIPAARSVAEIEEMLVENGATDTWKQYNGKAVTSLNFMVMTEFGKMPFKITVDAVIVRNILIEQHSRGLIRGNWIKKEQIEDIEYARNVGWRIMKDLIDSQMAVVQMGLRKLEQVFLADIFNDASGKTFFEVLTDKKFAGLVIAGSEPKLLYEQKG